MRGIQEKPLITGNKKNLLEKTDKNIFVRNRAYEIIRRKKWFRSKGSIGTKRRSKIKKVGKKKVENIEEGKNNNMGK